MREVTIAAIQMSCSRDVKENIEKAAKLIRAAAEAGAQIILPSELFERQYFCQERRYDYYDYAKPLSENDAVQSMKALAKELGVVIPVSFYEAGEGRQLFNSVAVIDADGEVLVHQYKIIFVHALRNALIPVITYVGPMIGGILTGSMVIESIFNIGGLGSKFVSCITNRDYTMIMATTLFLAVIMVGANLITDIVYKVIDPRIKLD